MPIIVKELLSPHYCTRLLIFSRPFLMTFISKNSRASTWHFYKETWNMQLSIYFKWFFAGGMKGFHFDGLILRHSRSPNWLISQDSSWQEVQKIMKISSSINLSSFPAINQSCFFKILEPLLFYPDDVKIFENRGVQTTKRNRRRI